MYFTSPRKVQLFGLCIEGTAEQYNYLIDENNTIGTEGSQSHGPNTVISMLHHAFQHYGFGKMACHIHCDNCAASNIIKYYKKLLKWQNLKFTQSHRSLTNKFNLFSGQNKNRYVIAYFCWRVMIGLHREMTVRFQISGHTKCLIDDGFAHIKKLYRR